MHSHHLKYLKIAVFCALAVVMLSLSTTQAAPLFAQDGWTLTEEYNPDFAVEWMQLLYDRIQAEGVNAPAAARIYGYAGVALYEAVVPGMPENRSLGLQLNGLDELPYPDTDLTYDWATTANTTLRIVLSALLEEYSADSPAAFTELFDAQIVERSKVVETPIIENSIAYGEALADELLEWIADDYYLETREMSYVMPTGEDWMWQLTTEGTSPVEPFWGQIRTFALEYSDECAQPLNLSFSTDPESTFYQQAVEVYEVGNDLSSEQRDIAEWWVDTPGETGTPAGHWVLIENQLVDQLDLNLLQAAEMYGMVGMALADSFISCWSLKYQVNLLRPVTYINANISQRWRPYIQTPPFPEYPSGHSVVSAAAADMLTFLFGTVAFTDSSHVERGMPARHFTSFEAAGSEAAISRLYGGIHYRAAIENGMRQGRCVASSTLDNIAMRWVGQGGE